MSSLPFPLNKYENVPLQLRCVMCDILSVAEQWRETETMCEDCGEHSAIACPMCGALYDDPLDGIYELLKAQIKRVP